MMCCARILFAALLAGWTYAVYDAGRNDERRKQNQARYHRTTEPIPMEHDHGEEGAQDAQP